MCQRLRLVGSLLGSSGVRVGGFLEGVGVGLMGNKSGFLGLGVYGKPLWIGGDLRRALLGRKLGRV